jgi:protein-L-isoaspartate(D-aspartate) O-methyltransferase
MFDCLQAVLAHGGESCKIVVWEHNSHVGDAAATEMGARGEHNVGHLCRMQFGDGAYLVGFGTDRGTVAAADEWDGPMKVMRVRPSHAESYERICRDAELPAFLLALREPAREALRDELIEPRLERAIGVVYRPATELKSHYFQAVLPAQFDEYVWFEETRAVAALGRAAGSALPAAHPHSRSGQACAPRAISTEQGARLRPRCEPAQPVHDAVACEQLASRGRPADCNCPR